MILFFYIVGEGGVYLRPQAQPRIVLILAYVSIDVSLSCPVINIYRV